MPTLNAYNVMYLAFRMAPFIIVAAFVMPCILFSDVKGIVYLAGLMIACGLSTLCENAVPESDDKLTPNLKCSIISAGEDGLYSAIPISMTVYSYTFWFLFMFILHVNKVTNAGMTSTIQNNIPFLICFPLLIVAEALWLHNNQCVKGWLYTFAAFMIGGIVGVLWGFIITKAESPNLQYMSNDNKTCALDKRKFNCTKK